MTVARLSPSVWGGGLFFTILLLVAGCDPAFQPLNPSEDRVYSLYGVLDVAADTQWIRVEPLAEPTAGGARETIDATVTLENLETGDTWQFHDSLMVVQTEPQHNYWTTAPVRAGTSYRVQAERSDGATTWATTTTPPNAPSFSWTADEPDAPPGILIYDTERLAGLKMRYFSSLGFSHDVSYYDATFKTPAGFTTHFLVSRDLERLKILNLDSAKVIAAAGGPDWPTWERYHQASIRDLTLPDSFSNVQGGHGMVAGVYRKSELSPSFQPDSQRVSLP